MKKRMMKKYLKAPFVSGEEAVQGRILTDVIVGLGVTSTKEVKEVLVGHVIPFLAANGIRWTKNEKPVESILGGRIDAHKLFLKRGGHQTYIADRYAK